MRGCFKNGLTSLIIFIASCSTVYAETSGEELYRQGKFKEALDAFRQADMDNPKEIRFRYNRGCAAFQDADLDGAEAAFTSVLKRTDDNNILFRAFYNRGAAAFKKDDFSLAARNFKEALKINPTDEDTRYNFELSLRRKAQTEEKKDQQKGCEKDSGKDKDKDNSDDADTDSASKDEDGSKDTGSTQNREEKAQEQGEGERNDRHTEDQEEPSGDLTGKDNNEAALQNSSENIAVTDAQVARNKAEALLENVKDDRSILLEGMKRQEKQTGKSGKKW